MHHWITVDRMTDGQTDLWLPATTTEGGKYNKEASWLYAELKSYISFQVSFVAYLKLSDETWNEMCYLKLLQIETFQNHHEGCIFETFRWDLKWDVLFETLWNIWNLKLLKWDVLFETWNFWNKICYLKLLKLFETFYNFSNPSLGEFKIPCN